MIDPCRDPGDAAAVVHAPSVSFYALNFRGTAVYRLMKSGGGPSLKSKYCCKYMRVCSTRASNIIRSLTIIEIEIETENSHKEKYPAVSYTVYDLVLLVYSNGKRVKSSSCCTAVVRFFFERDPPFFHAGSLPTCAHNATEPNRFRRAS